MEMYKSLGYKKRQKYPEISYEDAVQQYKFYKACTHKSDEADPNFEQNVQFREFFLKIKKRFDMQ